MKNIFKHIWVAIILFNTSLLFSAFQPVNLESPFKSSWYKKALDRCMDVWGNVRALNAMQNMEPKQRILCFDVLIGKLTQADMYVARLIASKTVVEEDDIVYLMHVLGLLNHACNTLNTTKDNLSDQAFNEHSLGNHHCSSQENEQIQCMLHVLHHIKKRFEAILGPEFILSKIEEIRTE